MIQFIDVNDFAEYLAEKLNNAMIITDDSSVNVFGDISVETLTELYNDVQNFGLNNFEDFTELTFN